MVNNSGISAQVIDGKVVLFYNGKQIDAVVCGAVNSFGFYVNGKKLEADGVVLAQTDKDATLKVVNDKPYFGDVTLISEGTCINITLADYNTLFRGGSVDGYARYNPSSVYNIVQDVSTAQEVTYTIADGVITFSSGDSSKKTDNMVYGGSLAENSLDLTATVTNTNCPFVSVYDFYPIVAVNGKVSLRYYVDNKMFDSICRDTIGDTFTVIVETESGSVVKNTTYAGEYSIDTPAFATTGETWFSVRCVDSNGVGSPVQFFDILVRNAVVKNYYTMQQSDLETYGIVPNDDTVEVAFANKAGFTSFFAAVKQEGYNGVVLLNNTYWIDYHASLSSNSHAGGANIVFPDEFTVDMNGSTFAATQCNNLASGCIVELRGNFDTHVINGNVQGNYTGFDFAATKANTGNPDTVAEGLGVTSMRNSRYCSFEGLNVSDSVGYESGIGGSYGIDTVDVGITKGQKVDIVTGEIVSDSGMMTTKRFNVENIREVMFGRNGFGGYFYAGAQREIFYSFYDSSSTYLKTIKSKLYLFCKVPSNAKYVRITGYGAGSSNWVSPTSDGELAFFKDPTICKNVELTDCSWTHTRSVGLCPEKVNGVRYKNCKFSNNALEEGTYISTVMLGDFEDGRNWTSNILVEGCESTNNIDYKRCIKIFFCRGLFFYKNKGISIWDLGGVEHGVIDDNTIPKYEIERDEDCYHPFVIYRNNTINTLEVTYSNNPSVEPIIAMSGTTLTKRCAYADLKLRNSTNGGEYVL